VVFHRDRIPQALQDNRPALVDYILAAPAGELITVTPVTVALPERARVQETGTCADCGEPVMTARLQSVHGQQLCIPCAGH
jgi:formylmethanofuran dehydrogenase subunit E